MARLTVVIGFMGAGKTTLARELAAARGVAHVDTDALLVEHFGRPIADVFATDGEAAFREAEERIVLEALARGDDVVVSLGGGSVLSERVRAALADHSVVLLDIGADAAWERANDPSRPLAADRAGFDARHAERAGLYASLAHAHLPQLDLARGVAPLDAALRVLRDAPAGTRMTWAAAASGSYPVFVGPGVLALAAHLGDLPGLGGRSFCVGDVSVVEHHFGALGHVAGLVEIGSGETFKTIDTCVAAWHALVDMEATRADHLVALGGGVTGDLAGFVAATYQRGIPVVQLPTTLVSQVDSALGGKTGVDLPTAKNYVGVYHQPAAVLADTATLATLPREEFAAGYAEVVKTALIAGGRLWERVAAGDLPDDDVIFDCARTKLAVVAADERDGGRRQVLNLGHTIGHALEVELGYGTLRHGEAVGLGLLAALRLSGLSDLRGQVSELLAAAGLPTTLDASLPGADPEQILAATRRDKKRTDTARTPFVLVRAPGDVVHGQDVADDDVALAVRELTA